MANTITVRGPATAEEVEKRVAKGDIGNKMILWEVDDAHPNGEISIADDGKEYEVAPTKAIKLRLADGRLLPVDKSAKVEAKAASKETPKVPSV